MLKYLAGPGVVLAAALALPAAPPRHAAGTPHTTPPAARPAVHVSPPAFHAAPTPHPVRVSASPVTYTPPGGLRHFAAPASFTPPARPVTIHLLNPSRGFVSARKRLFFGAAPLLGALPGWVPSSDSVLADDLQPDYSPPPVPEPVPAVAPAEDSTPRGVAFARQAEQDFLAGWYAAAERDLKLALVDDPRNARLTVLLAQGFFQQGKYVEAAGAVQQALGSVPECRWDAVACGMVRLYRKPQDYTDALRALEKERDSKPDEPALRLLLGYQYTFLGHAREAVRELDVLRKLAPDDAVGKKLRDFAAAKMKDEE